MSNQRQIGAGDNDLREWPPDRQDLLDQEPPVLIPENVHLAADRVAIMSRQGA